MENNDLVSFCFELSFKGETTAFQEVSGISEKLIFEEIVSGGENRFKHRLPTASVIPNLVLKRALVPEGSLLLDWCASLDQSLDKKMEAHDVSVRLLDPGGTVCRTWTFYNAYPVRYSVSDLQSREYGLVLEAIELAYTYCDTAPDIQKQ